MMPRLSEPPGVSHLWWIAGAAGVGFLTSFLLSDRLKLQVPVYQLAYVLGVPPPLWSPRFPSRGSLLRATGRVARQTITLVVMIATR
jgi:hypothetical protein